MSSVKLQVLLKGSLSGEQLKTVEHHLQKLGAEITGRGSVSLSAVMPREHFEKVFSMPVQSESAFAANPSSAPDLPVPSEIREHVESISQAPAHQRMD